MGEIAEMMLDGTLCEGCGEFMGDDVGFPRLCQSCAVDRQKEGHQVEKNGLGGWVDCGPKKVGKPTPKKIACPICQKRVKAIGLADHQRDAHERGKGSGT